MTDDFGTAWVFSYPTLTEALWSENEVYLPAHADVQFVISAFDDMPYRITADELFEPFELAPNARGVVLSFETSKEQSVLGEATGSQIPFHILPREEFEQIVTSREGCANGVVIPKPRTQPGALRDCEILLAIRDALVGDGIPLDWDVGTNIFEWEGTGWNVLLRYGFDGEVYDTFRLTHLDLPGHGLLGHIPPEMSSLSFLEYLDLNSNALTHGIPPELGELDLLQLRLGGNHLAGCIPEALRGVEGDLGWLRLPFCGDDTFLDRDRDFRLVYTAPLSEERREEDFRRATHAFDKVFELFGTRPYRRAILEYRDDGKYHWIYTIPFYFYYESGTWKDPGLDVHEITHYYSAELLRPATSWINEGISRVAEYAEVDGSPFMEFNFSETLDSLSCPTVTRDYKQLKDGYNIFADAELSTCGSVNKYTYLHSPHRTGMLFFVALSLDYSINGSKLKEFMTTLVELASDGSLTGVDHLQTAVMEVTGKDITPLLKLMEPTIRFVGTRGGIEKFFEENPKYKTERVSWID